MVNLKSGLVGLAGLLLVGSCGYCGLKSVERYANLPYQPTTVEEILNGAAGTKIRLEAEPVGAVMNCGIFDCITRITVEGESGKQFSFWGNRYNDVASDLAINVNAEANDGDKEKMFVEAEYGFDGFIPHKLTVNGRSF